MTLGTALLLVLTVYLILVAYGIVGISRSGARARRIAAVLLVLLPPALITGLLVATGEGAVVQAWARLFVAMPVVGAVVAVAAGRVAKAVAS